MSQKLFQLQTSNELKKLPDKVMKENKSKTKLFFILILIVYVIGWFLYTYLDYLTRKTKVLKNIDLGLYNTAISLKNNRKGNEWGTGR